jgi:hypothetical protein
MPGSGVEKADGAAVETGRRVVAISVIMDHEIEIISINGIIACINP